MKSSNATEIFEINIDSGQNYSRGDQDQLSENIQANSFRQSNDFGIRNLPKIFPFKNSNISKSLKDSIYTRFDRWSLKSYNSKLSRSKLKAVNRTSALLSGFAMVAMVELQLDYEDFFLSTNTNSSNQDLSGNESQNPISESILVIYAFVTCLLIGVHMIALMISTCILPQLDALSYEDLQIEPVTQYFQNQENKNQLPRNFFIKKVDTFDTIHFHFPYQKFHKFIETAWICSTVVGIFLFILEIGIIIYIKLYPVSKLATYIGGAVMIPTLILFILLSLLFHKYFAEFKIKTSKGVLSKSDTNEFII